MGMGDFLMYIFLVHTILYVAWAEFNIKEGETGKYRWYDEVSKRYRPCCYCPNEALLFDRFNDAFQVPLDYTDTCNGSVETVTRVNQTLYRYPICFCKEAYDLQTEFIGCVLPNTTNVLWNCDNGFLFPNVSVYTTCQPQCKHGNERPVTGYTSRNFRCNELKEWEQNPADVVCKDDDLADGGSVKMIIIILVSLSGIILVVFVVLVYCRLQRRIRKMKISGSRKQQTSQSSEACFVLIAPTSSSSSNESPTGSSITSTLDEIDPLDCQSLTFETIFQNELDACEQREKEKTHEHGEEEPLLDERNDSLVNVKSAGMIMHIQDGIPNYNVAAGSKVVIASNPVSDSKDFSIDRDFDEQKLNHFIINSVTCDHEGRYEWNLKVKDDTFTGSFCLNVEEDRQAPQGDSGSYPSLQGNSLITESLQTMEEPLIEAHGGVSLDDKAVVICHRTRPSSVYSHTASIYSSYCDVTSVDMPVQVSEAESKCINCECKLFDLMEDCNCNQGLINICHMLDPQTRDTAKCWKGFALFFQKELNIERCKINSILYHKKGDPEDGHMLYILQNILVPHGFTIGHIVYYFSQECSYREGVLKEVKKIHKKCQFCDKYLNSLK